MAKIALVVLLALVAISSAKPIGGIGGIGVAHKTAHVTSSVVSPYLGMGLGYGMMGLGYPGIGIGHTQVSHSISHAVPHYGLGMLGMKGLALGGLYPGGIGLGYGLMG